MPCVHYQFSSQLRYDTVTFSGLHISLGDLKHQIMGRQKLKAPKEEYTDDNALIPKNSSVIVRRVPVRGVKATTSGTSKAVCKNTISHFILQIALNSKQCSHVVISQTLT
uniref:DWNN domain-containing protein n=1 Tax=Strix occidentalis caurina TaxID=311401 RepID=A0A8D0FT58_STROC